MSKELDLLRQKRDDAERQLQKARNDEKALAHELSKLTRAERTHRRCNRGGIALSEGSTMSVPPETPVPSKGRCALHFSETGRESLEDKMKKLIERDVKATIYQMKPAAEKAIYEAISEILFVSTFFTKVEIQRTIIYNAFM